MVPTHVYSRSFHYHCNRFSNIVFTKHFQFFRTTERLGTPKAAKVRMRGCENGRGAKVAQTQASRSAALICFLSASIHFVHF